MNMTEFDNLKVGDIVEFNPAMDDWMRGDRYGTVTNKPFKHEKHGFVVFVKTNKAHRARLVHQSLVQRKVS